MDISIRRYVTSDQTEVVELWHRCGLVVPQNDPVRDIELKMEKQPELFLVGEGDGHVVATAMVGYDGHRGWINYLAVSPELQGQGIGRKIMEEAESRLRALGCPKINLQVRRSNKRVIGFYESIGFCEDDVIPMGKRLK